MSRRSIRLRDLQQIALDNATFRERQVRREAIRSQRQQKETELRAKGRTEIEQMQYYGHECTLSAEDLAELAERVKHKACWRSTW